MWYLTVKSSAYLTCSSSVISLGEMNGTALAGHGSASAGTKAKKMSARVSGILLEKGEAKCSLPRLSAPQAANSRHSDKRCFISRTLDLSRAVAEAPLTSPQENDHNG